MLVWWILHAGIGAAGTWLARRYALGNSQLLDQPGARRSHRLATPRGGGVSIVASLLVAAIALALRDPQQRGLFGAFAVGLLLIAGIGMIDDHRPLSPWLRLAVHALAASILALATADASGSVGLAIGSFVVALVLTNVWNFMDGINGLAASQAMLLGGGVLVAVGGSWGLLAAALAASCLGFLPYNFPRARIFLGDVGSGAIGFAIAALATAAYGRHGTLGFLLLLPLSTFLIDAGLTLLRRIWRGERWWTAHTQHAYQAWARRVGHTRVTLACAAWTLLGWALAWWLRDRPADFMLCIAMAWYTSGALSWWMLQRMDSRWTGERQRLERGSE